MGMVANFKRTYGGCVQGDSDKGDPQGIGLDLRQRALRVKNIFLPLAPF